MTKEALKLALEALEQLQGGCTDHDDGTVEAITVWCPEVIDAIKEALAQPEQEPVAEIVCDALGCLTTRWSDKWIPNEGDKLYTTSPNVATPLAAQRTWTGLTDAEAQWLYDNCRTPSNLIDMVEAKLKEKNDR
jgi:hypothetical protein